MTRDEKIIFYDKIEKALSIEHPVIVEGLTKTEIEDMIKSILGNVSEDNDTLEEVELHLKELDEKIKEGVEDATEYDEPVTVDELNEED